MRALTCKVICCLVAIGCLLDGSLASADTIVFIVNAANPVTGISSHDLKDYFLKRKKSWPDKSAVRFVDRLDSPERKVFLNSIVHKSSDELDEFWIGQKLYTGDSAPIQSASDSMSIQFVSTFPGAVGYISANTKINGKNVKLIEVLRDR